MGFKSASYALTFALLLSFSMPAHAGKKKSGKGNVALASAHGAKTAKAAKKSKRVFVPGFVKKDGTYVFPHFINE